MDSVDPILTNFPDATLGPAFMHTTPMSGTMAEFLRQMFKDLPSVMDMPETPTVDDTVGMDDIVLATAAGDGTGSHGAADSQSDAVVNSAMRFANNHPTPLSMQFQEIGLDGWVQLCNRLTLNYASRIGTESLRAFRQRRPDDIAAFILSEYEEMVREGGIPLEDEEIEIQGEVVRSCINVPAFLRELTDMVSDDIPRVVNAAWLDAAKNIAAIICPRDASASDLSLRQARQLCSHATHHGIHTYNFFHDLPVSPNTTAPLFTGAQARQAIALALRNILPLIDDASNSPLPSTFFGIYDRVRSSDGTLQFRLLETSSTHTTNIVSSLVMLVLQTCYIRNRQFPTLSERKMSELKIIYDSNKSSFLDVIACSQSDVPELMQRSACLNLLNILPMS